MLKKRIIPCLLLKGGRCVKGVNFKNHRDVGHPITNAKIYESQGADELIFLNIEPAKNERGA
ncbi:imidazole glycerol phosphate synthase subunit HisF, partial [Candidatus Falkowbacteria bacterium]|nr:imidazole glycerol phosphate synthase subunit HisF [Candidatus Falkowbacteria bacterium]